MSLSASNHILTAIGLGTSDTPNVIGGNNGNSYPSGHILYARCVVSPPECLQVKLAHRDTTAEISFSKTVAYVNGPKANTSVLLSGTYTLEVDSPFPRWQIVCTFADSPSSLNAILTVQNVLAIDLTAAFGAGNEPTAAEMDARLASSFLNSWFDGTNTLKGSYVVYRLATPTVEQFTPQPLTLPQGVVNMVVESSNGVLPSKVDMLYRQDLKAYIESIVNGIMDTMSTHITGLTVRVSELETAGGDLT